LPNLEAPLNHIERRASSAGGRAKQSSAAMLLALRLQYALAELPIRQDVHKFDIAVQLRACS
jgi:hypothetical protein